MLEALKELVWECNLELPKNNLVTMTSGNVSGRDPESGLIVIKPSGVRYEHLRPDDMAVIDSNGKQVEGKLRPSVDVATHLTIYRERTDVQGIVHTHSPYATSFAALGRSIPVYLTAIADEFGCAIPCAPYAQIGGEEIGKAVLKYIGKSPAILLKNHGVFTVGPTPWAAVKAAVMTEDASKTVHLALLLGQPDEIPPDEVERGHLQYKTKYGQA
jgi:L-ribulose-5-phosphate 4-epimerase